MSKQCSKCGVVKDISAFAKGATPDGYRYVCRVCHKAYMREYAQRVKPELVDKRCSKCGVIKDISSFAIGKVFKDGHQSQCRACTTTYRQQKATTWQDIPSDGYKLCQKCEQIKSLTDFPKNVLCRDGRQNECRACNNERRRHNYRSDPLRYRLQSALYRQRYPEKAREAARKNASQYYWKHREDQKDLRRQRYYTTRDKYSLVRRQYAARNRQHLREYMRRWRRANPERLKWENQKRRAAKLTTQVEIVDYNKIWQRDGGVCHICGGLVAPDDVQFDHIIPLSKGGPHTYENISVAHALCNRQKFNKLDVPSAAPPRIKKH